MTTTINGPKLQVPTVHRPLVDEAGVVQFDWQALFHSLQQIAYNGSRSGPTASRPTNAFENRWIGMQYFDTDLGKTVYLKSVTSTDVWVDGSGAPV